MVLGSIIGIGLTLTSYAPSTQLLSEEQALARAIQFCRAVEFGPLEPIGNRGHRLEVDKTYRKLGVNAVVFQFVSALVEVDLQTGRISSYSDFRTFPWETMNSGPRLSRDQLLSLAQTFHSIAGNSDQLHMYSAQLALGELPIFDRGNFFVLHLLRTHGNVPFTDDVGLLTRIEQRSGRLQGYGLLGELPSPPALLQPAINIEDARTQIAASVFSRYPRVTEIYERFLRLGIWRPTLAERVYAFRNLSPAQMQLAGENKGLLVYWSGISDDAEERNVEVSCKVYVDALTGNVLASLDSLRKDGVGGLSRSKRVAPFAWDIGPERLQLITVGRKALIDKARIWRAASTTKTECSESVIIHFGKMFLRCQFHEPSGLLSTERGGVRTFGKPSANLLKALRTIVKQSK